MKVLFVDLESPPPSGGSPHSIPGVTQISLSELPNVTDTFDAAVLSLPNPNVELKDSLEKVRKVTNGSIAILVTTVSQEERRELEKRHGLPVISSLREVGETKALANAVDPGRGVIGLAHFKGGVGASASALSLASCWARSGCEVAIVDLDDVSPQITEWGETPPKSREAVGRCVLKGTFGERDLEACLHPVHGFDRKLFILGQPLTYSERFHFKAKVLEGAPNISEFLSHLLPCLSARFEVVIIDLSRSWALSTFSSLSFCNHLLLVSQAESYCVQSSLSLMSDLKNESEELSSGAPPWSLVLTTLQEPAVNLSKLENVVEGHEMHGYFSGFFLLPFATRVNIWGRKGASLFDLGDERYRVEVKSLAQALLKRSTGLEATVSSKLLRKLQSMKAR